MDSRAAILERAEREGVRFLRLQFTDILGVIKNVEVPDRQFAEALDGGVMFDGSSIEGFVRIEESDMYLKPDLATFQVLPWPDPSGARVGRHHLRHRQPGRHAVRRLPAVGAQAGDRPGRPMGLPHGGRPRGRVLPVPAQGRQPSTATHDTAGYFDLAPVDQGEDVRREIVLALEQMGFLVEAAHHEVAPGQHEVDFRYDDVLRTADNVSTFRFVVKNVAHRNGLHATFMPKPIYGVNGSGMHTHQTLFKGDGNAFFDAEREWQLSQTCLHYVGGLLRHARGYCAITNPLVNSYKRLVPGHEAPTAIAWSEKNRSPLVRVPAARGAATRVELRLPDPSCNPYLALAVMLRAGLDGVVQELDPGPPVNKNIYKMSHRERRHLRIDDLPANLSEALDELEKSDLVRDALGDHIVEHFLAAKRGEWDDYLRHVSPWELERYLSVY